MKPFKWTKKREALALALAHGYTVAEACEMAGVSQRAAYNWKKHLEFQAEVDRLSLMVGVASRAERLRIAMQVIRQKIEQDGEDIKIKTSKDALEWLKFIQSETDGAKLDLAVIFQAMAEGTGDFSLSAPATETADGDGGD